MINQVVAPTGGQGAFGQGHADGVGEALAERTGGGLDAAGDAVFRVAGGPRAELAKLFQLIQREIVITGQMQKPVKQHRTMAGRQDEAITVGPIGRRRIEF